MILLQVFLAIISFPLLFSIAYLPTETLFQGNFGQLTTILYIVYFLASSIGLLVLRSKPIENKSAKKERYATLEFFFYMCVLAVPGIALVHYFIVSNTGEINLSLRSYGRVAFMYMIFALSISPLLTFIKNRKITDALISMRKIFGILSFLFFLRHGIEYFGMEYAFSLKHVPAMSYIDYVTQNILVRNDALTGVAAGIIMLILGITSNTVSIKILSGGLWKKVQSLVYPAFLLTSIHVAFSSRFDMFYVMFIIWLVYIRTMSYLIKKEASKQGGATTKYLCVPCGYIYDEALGDPDGGLPPGTKFADIPDGRVCPVCGVSKADFEPCYDAEIRAIKLEKSVPVAITPSGYMSRVSNCLMITKDVVEITLETEDQFTALPGQYAMLVLRDFDGEFLRAYSIVESTSTSFKFWIKLKETGRAGRLFKNTKIGDTIKIKTIAGNFVIKNTANPKVFIGTGTGIAPLYNMIINNSFSQNNLLFWGVRTKEDIFYADKLITLPNTTSLFFLSQEEDPAPYHHGRVHTDDHQFPMDSEFYLCGNKPMVLEQMASLKSRGYTNIYMEIF